MNAAQIIDAPICACGCGELVKRRSDATARKHGGYYATVIKGHSTPRLSSQWDADERGCWVCRKKPGTRGYCTDRDYGGAHRRAYALANGGIPAGHEIHHLCKNRRCVNPAHLEALTPAVHGVKHRVLLSQADMEQVMGLIRGGWRNCDIAAAYGISPKLISHYKRMDAR